MVLRAFLPLLHISSQLESSLSLKARSTLTVFRKETITSSRYVDESKPMVVPGPRLMAPPKHARIA